jgi:hypothetical protein
MTQQNKNNKKICPLLSAFSQDVDLIDCFEENCEWWNKRAHRCIIRDIATITDILYDIYRMELLQR